MAVISTTILNRFFFTGDSLRRESWPVGDRIISDGAEGGTIWYYVTKEDELVKDYKLGFHELIANDWEFAD